MKCRAWKFNTNTYSDWKYTTIKYAGKLKNVRVTNCVLCSSKQMKVKI